LLELQRDFGAFLGSGILRKRSELVGFADAQQELDEVTSLWACMPCFSAAAASAVKFTSAVMSCSPGLHRDWR